MAVDSGTRWRAGRFPCAACAALRQTAAVHGRKTVMAVAGKPRLCPAFIALACATLTALFWVFDAALDHFLDGAGEGSFWDPLLLDVSLHRLLVRLAFALACALGGLCFGVLLGRQRSSRRALADAEALLLASFEQTPAGILVAEAPDGRIRLANSAALGIRGETAQHLTEIPVELHPERWQTFHPDGTPFRAEDLPLSRAVLYGTTSRDVVAVIRRPTGEDRTVLANAAPVRDASGRVRAGVVVFSDITSRTRAEHELAAEKERLAVTLRSIGDGVIATDTDGRILLMNPVAETLTGWRQEDAAGKALEQVFRRIDEHTRQGVAAAIDGLRHCDAAPTPCESLLVARDGSERVITCNCAPIRHTRGDMIGAVLVFQDVTARRAMEREMTRAGTLESRGILAGGIAHDFSNILMSITGNIALARADAVLPADVRARLGEAERACARARDLTRQILTFAKGGEPLRRVVSLVPLIEDLASLAPRGAPVQLSPAVAPDLWAVEADPGQIHQVLQNLVLNASQAMKNGGTITIRAQNVLLADGAFPLRDAAAAPYAVRIEIIDQGVGIPPDVVPRIFDPFFSTKDSGTGLGLAIVYSIVKRHDGHIVVSSHPGEGTTFTVYLPACPQKKPEAAPPPEASLQGRGRVLVLDDDPAILEIVDAILRHLGYDPVCATDGEQAVAAYASAQNTGRPFDAVILDMLSGGGLDGVETLSRLKTINPGVRAVLATGYANDPSLAAPCTRMFDSVIVKPFTIEELGRTLMHVMKRNGLGALSGAERSSLTGTERGDSRPADVKGAAPK